MLLRIQLAFTTLVLFATTTLAVDLPPELGRELGPVAGSVILALPTQTLIDCDASAGVKEGDLFAVVKEGDKIVHPVTGALLGRQRTVKGWLRAARLHSGYTETTLLDPQTQVAAGDKVERFSEAEALLIDAAGDGAAYAAALPALLPQLRWLGYFRDENALPATSATPRLLFTLKSDSLDVREPRSGLLRHYPLQRPTATVAAPLPATVAEESWNGPSWSGEPVAIEVIDLDGDGQQETLIASARTLEIGRFSGRTYKKLATHELGVTSNLLGLDAADLDHDGKPELWITAARDQELDSFALTWDGQKFHEVATHLSWWLRNLNLPNEGRVLLGQRIGSNDFEGEIFRVSFDDQQAKVGASVELPKGTRLYGLARLTTAEGVLTVRLTSSDHLQVLSPLGEQLQESDELYGGSERFLPRLDPRQVGINSDTRNVYAPPRLETVNSRYLLAPANLGSRAFARQREFKQSRLDLLEWDGLTLRTLRSGRIEPGYLADFRKADLDNDGRDEVVMLLALSHQGFLGKGRYGLIVRETEFPKE